MGITVSVPVFVIFFAVLAIALLCVRISVATIDWCVRVVLHQPETKGGGTEVESKESVHRFCT